jgi:hypothetical protein
MKLLPVLALFMLGCFTLSAQCLKLQDGSTLGLNVISYPNTPMMADPTKWVKMKEEKKDLAVEEYNIKVLAGAITGTPYRYDYKVVRAKGEGSERAALTTVISGKSYTFLLACNNDTMFFTRNDGPIYLIDKGDTLGVTIQGVQPYPNKLKVGDALPTYEDVSLMVPKKRTFNVQEKVFSHSSTSTSSAQGFGYDAEAGKFGVGTVTTTTTTNYYNNIDVQVRETIKTSMYWLHNAVSQVIGEEEVTLGGEKVKAYIVDSETWIKSNSDASYESTRQSAANAQEAFYKKVAGKMAKMSKKMGFTNADGYMVMPKTEWFVPGRGVVKVVNYEMSGAISAISKAADLE